MAERLIEPLPTRLAKDDDPASLRFVDGLSRQFRLDEHEWQMVIRAATTLDELVRLEDAAADAPATVKGSMGQTVANPLFAEIRAHRSTFNTLMKSLRLPTELQELEAVRTAEKGRMTTSERGIHAARARHGF
ncbi:hypothetical protein [Streptomyces sp. x-19]|uniref:hypothetical protein n=1 Tax=Streptomyces sp. x-19 TaxID=2789280 RepID=UPI00397F16C5